MPAAVFPNSPILASIWSWWFRSAPSERLALLRIAVGLFTLLYHAPRYDFFGKRQPESMFDPVVLLSFFDQAPSVGLVMAGYAACLAANVAFILGVRHAVTGPLFALLFAVLTSYRSSFSMIYHSENLLVWHVLVLGLTPCADAFSWDARGQRSRNGPSYGWPIKLIITMTLALYFLAGVAKLAGELGLDWMRGEELRKQVASDAMRKVLLADETPAPPPLFGWDFVAGYTAIGVSTIVLEVGAPAALLSRRIGMLWAVFVFLMHWGILLVMGIEFRYPLSGVAVLAFFEPERLVRAVRRRLARRAQ